MSDNTVETTTLGGGCFWCLEAVYKRIDGIVDVKSGYAGGQKPNPTYEEVCTGSTGHAEVVQLRFDPTRITYREILDLFFKAHDPTTLNRQGADVGTQYRSVVYYHNDEQKGIAEATKTEMGGVYRDPIVTEIAPVPEFFVAEEYHQDYFDRNPTAGYCRVVIAPKLKKLGMSKKPLG
jgi:peptide-methionine (S)-S-oxide reductase